MPKWRRWWPAALLALLVLAAVLAPVLAPYRMDALDLAQRRAPPSAAHWFGTDDLGRDLFTRVLYGARISLAIGVLSAVLSAVLGLLIGATAGLAGRWVDALLSAVTDAMLSIPRLPLLMIAGATLTPSVLELVLLVAALGWMETARVMRSTVQSLQRRDFIDAARASGVPVWRLMWRHIAPSVWPLAMVAMTLAVGRGILLESAMSFFGVGVQPPTASWGNMLYQAQATMSSEPWLGLFPGAGIFITVLGCNVMGERLGRG